MRAAPLVVLVLGAGLALAAPASTATTKEIKIGDDFFVRASGVPVVKVTRNTRVRWRWTGNGAHDVKVSSGPVKFSSPVKTSGTYTKVVTRRGTYRIFCTIHGASDQSMTLIVR